MSWPISGHYFFRPVPRGLLSIYDGSTGRAAAIVVYPLRASHTENLAMLASRNHLRRYSICILAGLLSLICVSNLRPAFAQLDSANLQPRPQPAKPTNPPPAVVKTPANTPSATQAKKKLPAPENVGFKTRDGVQIGATYYASPLEKEMQKEAVPVILLHSFKGSRAEFSDLALTLQDAGCAVLAPDLRGHGQSTRRINSDGKEVEIEQALMSHQDFEAMGHADQQTSGDVEACNKFLRLKNNAKELNIDKLVLVGAEMGAEVAINWAESDWSWPRLPGAPKQGQDVKALVLLSPQWSFRGLPVGSAIGDHDFVSRISWLILVGEQDPKVFPESKRLYQALLRTPLPPVSDAPGKPAVGFRTYPTSLEGPQLLARNFTSIAEIVKFIDQQVAKTIHPWTDRKSPLD
jgi:pimeloyl-ACP methyl ester carboxylesterase